MDQCATWYGGRPRPRRHCLRWTQLPPRKGTQQPPTFRPTLLWHGRPSQQLLSCCTNYTAVVIVTRCRMRQVKPVDTWFALCDLMNAASVAGVGRRWLRVTCPGHVRVTSRTVRRRACSAVVKTTVANRAWQRLASCVTGKWTFRRLTRTASM